MLGQPRTTQRRARKVASDEGALRGDIVRLASRFGRYGYRRVTDMLRIEGWGVKHKRVERIWRQEGLKVLERQPKRGRLWLNDGSCIRLRPLYRGHVWSYDFVASRTHDGRALRGRPSMPLAAQPDGSVALLAISSRYKQLGDFPMVDIPVFVPSPLGAWTRWSSSSTRG